MSRLTSTSLDEARAALRQRQGAGARYDAESAPHTELAWALTRLCEWARPGIETPMYAPTEQRNAEIANGATFRDFPPEMLERLATDVVGLWQRRDEQPHLTLEPTDHGEPIVIGAGPPSPGAWPTSPTGSRPRRQETT